MTHRKILVCVSYIGFLVLCFLFIEAEPSFEVLFYVAGLSLLLAPLFAYFMSFRNLVRVGYLMFFCAGVVPVWYLAEKSFYSAYNACIDDGSQVRVLLEKYHTINSHYPDSLRQLDTDLPCSRFINGTILQYVKIEDGYELYFSDWLVTHRATHEQDFLASK